MPISATQSPTPSESVDKKAELLPRPLVKFLLKPQTKIETEAEIMENLDEHLKQLIRVIK